jgi:nitrogenase-associated protein
MATVIFYEKPGCINNTKQKALLEAAGHQLEVHNLLTEAWTVDRLRLFFGHQAITECFNRTAPAIKSGEVIPEELNAETTLTLMVEQPILIRRPLLQVGDRYCCGFDATEIDHWIGLQAQNEAQQAIYDHLMSQDLQTCPRSLQGEPNHAHCQ